MTALVQSIALASVLLFIRLRATDPVIASEKSCYGPDYTNPYPFTNVDENYCIHAYFDNTNNKQLKITLTQGDKLIGSERLSDIDTAFEEKKITDKHFPDLGSYASKCTLILAFDDVFVSDEWATVCPQFALECMQPIHTRQWYHFDCFSVGDDDKDDIPQITGGVTDFTFDLLSTNALTENIVKDLFVSPFSITCDLVMAMMAARNETLAQIANVFDITKANYDVFDSFDTLIESLQQNTSLTNTISNRLWINENWKNETTAQFKQDFTRFGEIIDVNYHDEPAVTNQIIEWTASITNNMIKEPLMNRTLSANTVMLFTNAMYFSAKWFVPFNRNVTETFRDDNDKDIKVKMMKSPEIEWNEFKNNEVQVIEIPIKDNFRSDFSFIMIRPTEEKYLIDGPKSTIQFEKMLNRSTLKYWLQNMNKSAETTFNIMLPFLEMYNMQDITDALKTLGITDLFDPKKCDLTGLTKEHYAVYETDLNRQDKLILSNFGIEIASFTSDGDDGKDDTNQGPVKHADLPFLFLIMDRSIDLILYAGRVTNPKGWRIQDDNGGDDDNDGQLSMSSLFLLIIMVILISYCGIKYVYNITVMKLSACEAVPHLMHCRKCIYITKRAVLNVRTSGLENPGAVSPPERYAELMNDDAL